MKQKKKSMLMNAFINQRSQMILSAFALALVFSLVFYTCNTPLGPAIGSDNAMYLTMGTAIADGYLPYTDIFDHKGPLLFALQALPQLLSAGYSTCAVFIQQMLFLFGCLLVVADIAKRIGVKTPVLIQLVYLALIAALVEGGNLSEEYANFFTLLGLDLIICTFPEKKHLLRNAAGIGALSMLCFLLRANNALPLWFMTLGLSLFLLICKDFHSLVQCALGFLLGSVLALLPFFIWLYTSGALSDAVYGAIIHNFLYSETSGGSRIDKLLHDFYGHRAMRLAALSCLGAVFCLKNTSRTHLCIALVFGALGAGIAAFISHKFYVHYLVLGVPSAIIGIVSLFSQVQKIHHRYVFPSFAIAVLLLCMPQLILYAKNANTLRIQDVAAYKECKESAIALINHVPESERDRFMAYRVEPKWYVAAKALPCMRFYFLQEILADADPAVMDEIVETFENDPPLWLVIFYNRTFEPAYDARVAKIFETAYEFVDAAGDYQLLHLRTP